MLRGVIRPIANAFISAPHRAARVGAPSRTNILIRLLAATECLVQIDDRIRGTLLRRSNSGEKIGAATIVPLRGDADRAGGCRHGGCWVSRRSCRVARLAMADCASRREPIIVRRHKTCMRLQIHNADERIERAEWNSCAAVLRSQANRPPVTLRGSMLLAAGHGNEARRPIAYHAKQ